MGNEPGAAINAIPRGRMLYVYEVAVIDKIMALTFLHLYFLLLSRSVLLLMELQMIVLQLAFIPGIMIRD